MTSLVVCMLLLCCCKEVSNIKCYICGWGEDIHETLEESAIQVGVQSNNISQCKTQTLVNCKPNSICQTMIMNQKGLDGYKSILKGCLEEIPWTGGETNQLKQGFCRPNVYIADAMQCICTKDECNAPSFTQQYSSFKFIEE